MVVLIGLVDEATEGFSTSSQTNKIGGKPDIDKVGTIDISLWLVQTNNPI